MSAEPSLRVLSMRCLRVCAQGHGNAFFDPNCALWWLKAIEAPMRYSIMNNPINIAQVCAHVMRKTLCEGFKKPLSV